MTEELQSRGAEERGGGQLKSPRSSRGWPRWGAWVLVRVLLGVQAACATGYPMGGTLAGAARHRGMAPPEARSPRERERPGVAREAATAGVDAASEGVVSAEAGAEGFDGPGITRGQARARTRYEARGAGAVEETEDWDGEGVGGPDGVGDGRSYKVPFSVDYFQGFLVRAGVPVTALPGDGRTLSPPRAMELLPCLLSTPVTLGNFGLRRMAAHLLLEVATGEQVVTREELHARMRRFSQVLVLRPDGYLVKPGTGEAVQKAGEVVLAEDGTLRAGRFEVGPFYALDGGRLFPVDQTLAVPHGAEPAGIYAPDDNPGLAVAEGAVVAVVDMVEGLHRLVFYTGETLEGLTQLPGAVRAMYENAPQLWEEFRHKPYAERVRTVSRLATGAVLTVGTAGAGTAKVMDWGGRLGRVSVPLLSVTGDGLLAVRLVAVPVGSVATAASPALGATYVLHMANTGAQGSGGGGWPPVGGPGQWVEDTSAMSEQARDYQAQVTGAPKRWCYKICRDGNCVEYDGYEPKTGTLLEGKAREYDKWFDEELEPRWGYKGLKKLVNQAERQFQLAGGLPLRWHVAEPRMVAILRKHFDDNGLHSVEVVYTQPLR